jgi:cobalamin biosynthesis protein CobW
VIPVLVVSGFLGSGKTTLVRSLLEDAQRAGVRLAVVSNEFGDLGIDQALLQERPGDYVELSGGCICCRLSDTFVETLTELWERARPDRIVVETSGVALPFDTQLHLWRDPVSTFVSDDVAVVVVNAEQLLEGRDLTDTFAQQVSSADLLVLNQVDRVPEASLPKLEARLREIEPEAPILRAVHADVPPALLFPPDPDGVRSRRREAGHAPSHSHEPFVTEVLEIPSGTPESEVEARVRACGALRAKGFVETDRGPRLLQGVGARLEFSNASRPPPTLLGRVVVIRRQPGS